MAPLIIIVHKSFVIYNTSAYYFSFVEAEITKVNDIALRMNLVVALPFALINATEFVYSLVVHGNYYSFLSDHRKYI